MKFKLLPAGANGWRDLYVTEKLFVMGGGPSRPFLYSATTWRYNGTKYVNAESIPRLTQADIQGVVTANQPLLKSRCWQPALQAGAPSGPTTVRVMVSFVINAAGDTAWVKATGGENDFPGLSACIACLVWSWRFPLSSGSTPVSLPFAFAAK